MTVAASLTITAVTREECENEGYENPGSEAYLLIQVGLSNKVSPRHH